MCSQSHLFHFQAPPKQIPRTIENTRIPDETIVAVDDEEVTYISCDGIERK